MTEYRPQTTSEAAQAFRVACREFIDAVAEALRLYRVLGWLERKLRRLYGEQEG